MSKQNEIAKGYAYDRAALRLFGYVSEWAKTERPTDADMVNLRREVAEVEKARDEYRAASDALVDFGEPVF